MKCFDCNVKINLKKRPDGKTTHRCGEIYCRSCLKYQERPHLCYIRALPPDNTNLKALFFDIESTQDSTETCQRGYSPKAEHGCGKCESKTNNIVVRIFGASNTQHEQ